MSAIEGTLCSVLFTALIMSSENGSSLVMLHSILSHLEPLSYSLLHENVSVMVAKWSYEAKIEESEKATSQQESNQEHLWLEMPVLYIPVDTVL